jgi:hypothetical protein
MEVEGEREPARTCAEERDLEFHLGRGPDRDLARDLRLELALVIGRQADLLGLDAERGERRTWDS